MDLTNRVAMVTGGGSGIGKATAAGSSTIVKVAGLCEGFTVYPEPGNGAATVNFNVWTGADLNGDGVLEANEVTRSLVAKLVNGIQLTLHAGNPTVTDITINFSAGTTSIGKQR